MELAEDGQGLRIDTSNVRNVVHVIISENAAPAMGRVTRLDHFKDMSWRDVAEFE